MNDSRFSDLHLLGNGSFGIRLVGDRNTIELNEVARMDCAGSGININGGSNGITLNRVEFNGIGDEGAGIIVASSPPEPRNTVSRNLVRQNTQCGVAPPTGFEIENVRVKLNRVEDMPGSGFDIGSNSIVERNIAIRNGFALDPDLGRFGSGFFVLGDNNHFEQNRADYNGDFGINDNGTGNTYKRNRCTGNRSGKSAVFGTPSPADLCR